MKVNVDDVLAYNIALYVINNDKDHELKSIKYYRKKRNICRWKMTIQVKSNSLCKAKLFGLVVRTLEDVKLIRYI